MANISTKLYTMLFGIRVGQDGFGNSYYESKSKNREFNRKSRWVIYNGIDEASKVDPTWFNWLHYQSDTLPDVKRIKHEWENTRTPNLTGTKHAYYPNGHLLAKGKRDTATGDYEAWRP